MVTGNLQPMVTANLLMDMDVQPMDILDIAITTRNQNIPLPVPLPTEMPYIPTVLLLPISLPTASL